MTAPASLTTAPAATRAAHGARLHPALQFTLSAGWIDAHLHRTPARFVLDSPDAPCDAIRPAPRP